MVRCRGMTDANATTQQHRHREPAAAHILDFGDLVDELACRIEQEICEHEIDDWSRAAHRRAARKPYETSLANRRVTQSLWTVNGKETSGGAEIAAALTD